MAPEKIRWAFFWFSVWFSLSQTAVSSPLVVASSLLSLKIGNVGNGIFTACTCVSSLLLGMQLVDKVGSKGGILFSMSLYTVDCALFAVAVAFEDNGATSISAACFYAGSVCGGLGAGVMWTSQGAFFAATANVLAARAEQSREIVTARLAGIFALIYLVSEVSMRLVFSGLQRLGFSGAVVSAIFAAVTAMALAMMTQTPRIEAQMHVESNHEQQQQQQEQQQQQQQQHEHQHHEQHELGQRQQSQRALPWCLQRAVGVTTLWKDPVLWLLSPTNFTFGFCSAFMNGYVNVVFVEAELGEASVPFLAAVTALVAAVFSPFFGWLGGLIGKAPIVMTGGFCTLCIPLSLLVSPPCHGETDCSGWGWGLAVLFVLQGVGRAVYESTNRAVFSDVFVDNTSCAFANAMLQTSIALTISFFTGACDWEGKTMELIVAVLALLTIMGFLPAMALHRRRKHSHGSLIA